MKATVIITDCIYRSSIAIMHTLVKLGEKFIAVTTEDRPCPPAFKSRYPSRKVVLPSDRESYKDSLLQLCGEYDRPVIFPVGVFTLNILSENKDAFLKVADMAVADKNILDRLNDKKESKKLACTSGIRVPSQGSDFPMVAKPFCGEKFGLKASDRYRIVYNKQELDDAVKYFSSYDPSPIVEEYIDGRGVGVSAVIGRDGVERSAFCHKRLSEYPASGGPSSSLVAFYDRTMIDKAVDMLKSAGFVGIAMLEFKEKNGEYYFLEINPRVWGSFGATDKTDSDFVAGYLSAARNTEYAFEPRYKAKKVKFVPNIFASVLSYVKTKKPKQAFITAIDALNPFVPDAIFSIKDPLPSIYDIFRKRR